MANQSTCKVCGERAPDGVDVCSIECGELQDLGNPKAIFWTIVKAMESHKLAGDFDNVDHDGTGIPNPQQVADAVLILAKGRELRRLLRGE